MSPKVIDKEQRKKEIALIALDLFAEKGLEATSISEVAKQAGIGKGTVYEYFTSKEELIFSAFMVWIEQMMGPELQELLLSVEEPEERLRKLVQGMMEAFISDERVVKITLMMFQVMLKENSFLQKKQFYRHFYKIFRGIRKLLTDILLEGIAQGVFRPEIARDAEKITVNLFAYLDGIGFHYFLNRNEFDLMEQVNFYLDRLIEDLRKT